METIGLWQITETGPTRMVVATVGAEKHLEDWIERDPALLERGLVVVGRQLKLEGGPLDLLALDPQGRWVLIEIKRDRLRREAIAQAIDYVSCLHELSHAQLQAHCDDYLRKKGSSDTLHLLLKQRGQSLDSEDDEREVLIYLVGTGLDAGLDRMVRFLVERVQLSVRLVTFSVYQDVDGRTVLAREIHETLSPVTKATRSSPSTPADLSTVVTLAEQNGLGQVLRPLLAVAEELGFFARPYVKSIMFTPPANKARCLFVVWVDRLQKDPGFAKAYLNWEAFEQFYGISEVDFVAALGSIGYVKLDQDGAQRIAHEIHNLMKVASEQPTAQSVSE